MLALDGGLLAACLNAASVALVDAGVPMPSVLGAVASGCILPTDNSLLRPEPVLDLNGAEEVELPFLTLGTVAGETEGEDKVAVLLMETRVQMTGLDNPLDIMMRVGLDGCKQVRRTMEDVIRKYGAKMLQSRK